MQHMANGTVVGRFEVVGKTPSIVHTASYAMAPADPASAEHSLLVTELWTDATTPIAIEVGGTPNGRGGTNSTVAAWGAYVEPVQAAPKEGLRAGTVTRMAIATRVVVPGSEHGADRSVNAANGDGDGSAVGGMAVSLRAGQPVYLVTAVVTSIDAAGNDPLPAAKAALVRLTPADLVGKATAHSEWWARFWARSSISLPDWPEVERFWYSAQYVNSWLVSHCFGCSGHRTSAHTSARSACFPLEQHFFAISCLFGEILRPIWFAFRYTSGASARWNGAGSHGAAKTAPALQSVRTPGCGSSLCQTEPQESSVSATSCMPGQHAAELTTPIPPHNQLRGAFWKLGGAYFFVIFKRIYSF